MWSIVAGEDQEFLDLVSRTINRIEKSSKRYIWIVHTNAVTWEDLKMHGIEKMWWVWNRDSKHKDNYYIQVAINEIRNCIRSEVRKKYWQRAFSRERTLNESRYI